jgi:hypothetical protein
MSASPTSNGTGTFSGMKQYIGDRCIKVVDKRKMDPAVENVTKIVRDMRIAVRTAINFPNGNESEVVAVLNVLDVSVPSAMGCLRTALYAELVPGSCDATAWDGGKSVEITMVIDLKSGTVKSLVFASPPTSVVPDDVNI